MKRFLTALASLAVPSFIWAVPADPRPRTVTNPDGSTVQVRVHGDENFHFMTDVDCTSILHRNAEGFVVSELRNGVPVAFNRENVEMRRAEKEAQSLSQTRSAAPSIQRMASLNSEGRTNYPTVGEGIRSLVVLVEFQDVQFTVKNPKEYYTRQLNEPGFSDYNGCGSARDYYKAASHGLYAPQFDVYGPVKISKNTTYFADDQSKTKNMEFMIREALTALHDSGELDLSNYDYDEDGTLDTVFIYYAGYGSADSDTQTIWPHQSTYWGNTFRLDGIKVGPYACANELDGYNPRTHRQPWRDGSEPWVGGIGTFCHEYGHVLGLPDMYDVQYSGNVVTPGQWDVMDQGSYNFNGTMPPLYSAYEQWVCRWLEYADAEDFTHYDLKALGHSDTPQAVRIRIPRSTSATSFESEYFVLEARDNSGWDSCFPDSGLMIWRINYDRYIWSSNLVNSNTGSNVEIVYANGADQPIFATGALYEGAKVELVPSRQYRFWQHPVISAISYNNDNASVGFDYNIAEPTEVMTVLHDNPTSAEDGSKSFKLHWDKVENVESYLVTIRVASNHRIVNDFDAKNVGNVTSIWVDGISSMQWLQSLEAYVTCVVNGMISSKDSNIITFRPKELPTDDSNAVDAIDSDNIQISGGVGCVIAPEGAVIYNMSGQQLRNENLAPGIYLVSFGSRTAKVLVR
ncbi:MAG: M6 family metalloprotease domain-containing protein [Muribaculum sp.]|nr:M6 family metalloprotease domain-containing protein [Muribaculum sp.]